MTQLSLPIRPWVLPGNPSWNERGQRFSWRMMLRHKDCLLWYKIQSDGDHLFVPAKMIMTPNQIQRAPRDPELVRQGALKLQQLTASIGFAQCQVFALDLVSLNGRKPRPLVDPDRDLTKVDRGWFRDDWVLQDPGPLPDSRWYRPFDDWWQQCELGEAFAPLKSLRPSEAEAMFDALRAKELAKTDSRPSED